MVLTAFLAGAWAGPDATADALDRLEEILELRIDDGTIDREAVVPALLVSLTPRYTLSEEWFSTEAIATLGAAFGTSGLRLCEACMAPRTWVEGGTLSFQAGPMGLDEIVRLDEQTRGTAAPARTAIWVDEQRGGVSIRIVDLGTGRIVFAQNVDPLLVEHTNSRRMATLTEELERRARGDSLTQAFVDASLYPRQHISLDFTDQWGKTNANMSGITISLVDPILGLGVVHYRRLPPLNMLVGAQLVVSLPAAITRAVADDVDTGDFLDPLLTGVGVVRVPFGRSNYGALATVSTNGAVGVGLSLMNFRLLPVIP